MQLLNILPVAGVCDNPISTGYSNSGLISRNGAERYLCITIADWLSANGFEIGAQAAEIRACASNLSARQLSQSIRRRPA
jgi:hypothetical protein